MHHYAFPKNDKGKALCDEFSEYIKQIKSDGTLQQIDDIWFGTDESVKDILLRPVRTIFVKGICQTA